MKIPRNEKEVLAKIEKWCADKFPNVEIQKEKYYKLIESTGERKMIDATVIGRYKKMDRIGGKGCLIAELEFEEHKAKYSILNDMVMITIPLRKLDYWRNDISQFWIKVDSDGTPFMINFKHIKANETNLNKMPKGGKWQRNDQITRIITAKRKSKTDIWPSYVITGWDNIFNELERIIVLGGF